MASVTLQRYGVIGSSGFSEAADRMYQKYVTGIGPTDEFGIVDTESKGFVPPTPLPLVGGEPVVLTYGACKVICAVQLAQVQEDSYDFVELAMMCVNDDMAGQLSEAASWVTPQAEKEPDPNTSGGLVPPSSTTA